MLEEAGRHLGLMAQLPGGPGDLTLAELQEMATRQQQQMDAQQQVLVAKEQRLKYLKQQEARHAQLASESERLRRIRERVESQELKLKKLRALRGQAEQYRNNNGQLNSELDAVKSVFNEKEKELAMAVSRVDQLTRQLKDLRQGTKANAGLAGQKHAAAAALELEKLRKELLLRNQLNDQQTNNIAAKEKVLQQKRGEVKNMDNRIMELQQRLKKRKLQEDQNNQAYKQAAGMQNKQNKENINAHYGGKAGDPYIQYGPRDVAKDDSYSQSGHFAKQDPKYQTLPAGVRLGPPNLEHSNDPSSKASSPPDEYNLPVVLPVASTNSNQTRPAAGYHYTTSHHQDQSRHPHPPPPEHIYPPAPTHPGKPPQKFNNNDFSKPNQNFFAATTAPAPTKPQPQPTPSQRQTHRQTATDQPNNNHPPTSSSSTSFSANNKFFPPPTNTPRDPTQSHGKGGGGESVNPVISIQEEERQAGSGQSSPASSEGSSNSSGGILIKDGESNINQAPIGSVSAMIQRLNKGGNNPQPVEDAKTSTPPPPPPSSSASSVPSHFQVTPSNRDSQNGQPKPIQEGVSTFLAGNKQQQHHHHQPYPRPMMASQGGSVEAPAQDDWNSSRNGSGQDSPPSSYPTNTNSKTHPPASQQGPQLNLKPAPTYRYASKNQIANTYMGRLGGVAMEKYQQNLNKLYKNLETQDVKSGSEISDVTQIPDAGTAGQEVEGQTAFGSVSPHDYPDIASDKGSYKLNTPKQVRRRHSDGESDDVNKALQDRQELEAKDHHPQQGDENSTKPSKDKEKQTPNSKNEKHSIPDNETNQRPTSNNSKTKPSTAPPTSTTTTTSTSSSLSSPSTTAVPAVSEAAKPSPPPSGQDSSSLPSPSNTAKPHGKAAADAAGVVRRTKSNLKNKDRGGARRSNNRVSFNPLALLLDGSLEGELDLVKKVAVQVDDVSTPNDEGITALHNAICAGHYEIVKFLIEFGCDVNSPDSDGWTPLHCAASCNNLPMVRFLVEHGACVFATTISDQETAADKCEEDEDGYDGCSDYLYSIQEKLGITNNGDVYAVFDYQASNVDELSFVISHQLTVLRKGDEKEKEWWWARLNGKEGYIPRNLLGLYPRVIQQPSEVSEC